ncbi:MAG: CinA family protein [Prevotella sp.]|nr:CinA family protein [Bacteroidales bacterium]MDD6510638.1 CinA family protein [Prevotella sp.]MDD6744995.1 CinA family protein [Bacteroidales bacterium]MDY3842817.1 CinA family protein [Prevotella sp.]
MELQSKILSKEILHHLYANGKTLGTAESCTGGRIAETIIAVPGASNYFKGGIVCYSDDVKIRLLNVSEQVLAEKTAVCEEVAVEMVKGACETLGCDYAIASTGIAGPGGGTPENPVGTIWIGYGSKDEVRTLKLTEDQGRDINLSVATIEALRLFLDFYKEKNPMVRDEEK